MSRLPDCQTALLTPPGRGAVATLGVYGAGAAECVGRFFQPAAGKPVGQLPLGRIAFGHWRTGEGEACEEIVVCRTAADELELHCHGGRAAGEAVLDVLKSAGCHAVDWRDRLREAAADPIAAEAQAALARAPTARTAEILLDQWQGALATELEQIVNLCEARSQGEAVARLAELAARGPVGLHLCRPWRVVLAGPPNVGKSSLLNAIAGYTRAIVFDQPGTTRDVLAAPAALDGWPVELMDTAGLRTTADCIERQGVARAERTAAAADLPVLVFDRSRRWSERDGAVLSAYPHALVVHNKSDLSPAGGERPGGVCVSALTGANVERLIHAIAQRLVPQPPPPGAAVPFTHRQAAAVEEALSLARSNHLAATASGLRELLAKSELLLEP